MSERNADGGIVDHVDWNQSVIVGAIAWVAGLVLTYAVVAVADVDAGGELEAESTFDLSVWLYHEAIGGAFDIGVELETLVAAHYYLLESNVWGLAVVAHYLIPAVVLAAAGYVLAGQYTRGETGTARDPTTLQIVVGGTSAAVGFAAAAILSMLLFGDGPISYDSDVMLLVSVVYPLIFAALGAGLRSRIRTVTVDGLAGGIGAVAAAMGLWYVLGDGFDGIEGADGFSDLSGTTEHLEFVAEFFVTAHAMEYGETVPEWYVVVGIAAVSGALVYRSRTSDWVVGAGRGARIAVGYALVAAVVILGTAGSQMNDLLEYDGVEREFLIQQANYLFGTISPRFVVIGGILWAAAFGAIGGALGAKLVESNADSAAPSADAQAPRARSEGSEGSRPAGKTAPREERAKAQPARGPREDPSRSGTPEETRPNEGREASRPEREPREDRTR